ncbi:MAG: iron-sulfur cluster assembly scaffold protein [Armatimonadota bacterium]
MKGFAVHNCGAAIAVSSIVSEMAIGKTIEEALKITKDEIAKALGGLPPQKMHCSNLGTDALHNAIRNYLDKNKEIKTDKSEESTFTECGHPCGDGDKPCPRRAKSKE